MGRCGTAKTDSVGEKQVWISKNMLFVPHKRISCSTVRIDFALCSGHTNPYCFCPYLHSS